MSYSQEQKLHCAMLCLKVLTQSIGITKDELKQFFSTEMIDGALSIIEPKDTQ